MQIEPPTPHHLQDISRIRRFPQLEINLKDIMNDKTLLMRYCIQILKNKADKRTPQEIELLKSFAETVTFFSNLKLNDEEGNIIERCVQVLKHQHLDENEVLSTQLKHQILFRVGDPGSLFYIILEGTVGICIKLPNQTDPSKMELKEINQLRAGASFGELALLNENVQRSATIVAKCDCELAIMEKRDYKALLGQLEKFKVEKKISFLCQFPFFQAWSFREVKTMSYHFEELICTFNTRIYAKNQPSDYFYVVREGLFELSLDLASRREENGIPLGKTQPHYQRICQLGQGEFFGEETFLLAGKGFAMKLPKQEVPLKRKTQLRVHTTEEHRETEEPEKAITQPTPVVPAWSRRIGDVYCVSQSAILYRISREDIQRQTNTQKDPRRFWESRTQNCFLSLLQAIFEFRSERINEFSQQYHTALQDHDLQNRIQAYLQLAQHQQTQALIDQPMNPSRAVTSKKVEIFNPRIEELISNNVLYRLQRREDAEGGSTAHQLVEQRYRDELDLQEMAMKKFSQLFKVRNYSFAQVKNFFTQKHLLDQSVLDKVSYRKLLFRFKERKPSNRPISSAQKPYNFSAVYTSPPKKQNNIDTRKQEQSHVYQKLSEIVGETPKPHKLQTICLDSYMHSIPRDTSIRRDTSFRRDASFASESKYCSQEQLLPPTATMSTTAASIRKTSRSARIKRNSHNSQDSSWYTQRLRNGGSAQDCSVQLFSVTGKPITCRPKSSLEADNSKRRR